MKKEVTTLAIILFVTPGFVGCKQSSTNNDLITVDVTKSYPEKELILQDFLDVEYIPLETKDEFITQGDVMAIGNKYILVKNWTREGDIYVFDRKTGKGLRKINRKGKGPEEYNFINGIVLDEDNNEIFVNCPVTKKIFVYDLLGNFKRSFKYTEDVSYSDVFNYDKDNLICYNELTLYKDSENRGNESCHVIISKQDGSITRNITIPFDVFKTPFIHESSFTAAFSVSPIIPYHDNWLLVETSSDTVYDYVPKENKLNPFLVVKNPTRDPEIFLTMGTLTDRYYFMETLKKEIILPIMKIPAPTELMYDKQKNSIFTPAVFNGDYVKKQKVDMTSHPVNNEIAAFETLEAYQLVEAYKKDELKGKLKEIAADLNEGSNTVIMVMKYKK